MVRSTIKTASSPDRLTPIAQISAKLFSQPNLDFIFPNWTIHVYYHKRVSYHNKEKKDFKFNSNFDIVPGQGNAGLLYSHSIIVFSPSEKNFYSVNSYSVSSG